MKIRTRITLSHLVIVGACFSYLIYWLVGDVRQRYLEAMEECLVDTANVISSILVERTDESEVVDQVALRNSMKRASERKLSAKIYRLIKTKIDLSIYVTNGDGVVIFDSNEGAEEGKDYSSWRDVKRTLKGKYGARATRTVKDEPSSLSIYVAAPIVRDNKTVGVLSVSKPITSANEFMKSAKENIVWAAIMAALVVMILSALVSNWITSPISRLTQYALDVRDGERVSLPKLGKNEMGTLGEAFEEMRDALEGKKHVERYVQTLTHEIKSPLSAIRGAAELMDEKMPPEMRARFLSNIRNESERIRKIIDRLLLLSSIESRKGLQDVGDIDLFQVTSEVIEGLNPVFVKKKVAVEKRYDGVSCVRGELFLLRQAFQNILKNALEFSPEEGRIWVSIVNLDGAITISVEDEGPGIPDYALNRVTERFYSLSRPDTGKKSSGLGLNFVKEVCTLHQGKLEISNRDQGGARALIRLPGSASSCTKGDNLL